MADLNWALDPLTKPGGDNVDLMTPEGRELWISRRMLRLNCTLEEATQYVDGLIERRKTVAASGSAHHARI
jgi:hypothetical protein